MIYRLFDKLTRISFTDHIRYGGASQAGVSRRSVGTFVLENHQRYSFCWAYAEGAFSERLVRPRKLFR